MENKTRIINVPTGLAEEFRKAINTNFTALKLIYIGTEDQYNSAKASGDVDLRVGDLWLKEIK